MAPDESATPDRIDAALAAWRQGDCVVAEQWFVHRFAVSAPITDGAKEAAAQGADLAESKVAGFVVVTQTCDVVRRWADRPYVEVSPLVEVDADKLHDVERGRRPMYGFIPGIAERQLVADLDRTMTVEKAVVAEWSRTSGCATDVEARGLAAALARKRARFAFPDDFTEHARRLQSHLTKRHDKNSPEGLALRALREIRIQATPTWEAPSVNLTIWFIVSDADAAGSDWARWLETWMALLSEGGRFSRVHAQVAALADLTAADYVGSDALDLDHLSSRGC